MKKFVSNSAPCLILVKSEESLTCLALQASHPERVLFLVTLFCCILSTVKQDRLHSTSSGPPQTRKLSRSSAEDQVTQLRPIRPATGLNLSRSYTPRRRDLTERLPRTSTRHNRTLRTAGKSWKRLDAGPHAVEGSLLRGTAATQLPSRCGAPRHPRLPHGGLQALAGIHGRDGAKNIRI